MKYFTIIITLACLFKPTSVLAQTCKDNIQKMRPSEHYLDQGETIIDVTTGLEWQRCSFGQEYNDGQCNGEPSHLETWQKALQQASTDSSEWRLPNINELSSLIDRQCYRPAINLAIFPATPSAWYYSSTPNANANAIIPAHMINFASGVENFQDITQPRYMRLVRSRSTVESE